MFANIVAAAALALTPCDYPGVSTVYDRQIRSAVMHYWAPERRVYHCWLKAQLLAESSLNPGAQSSAGAKGIAQFLPQTFKEEQRLLGFRGDIYDAHASIIAAAHYTERLSKQWSSNRTEICRLHLSAASYNAGLGNILKAQRLADGAPCWDKIHKKLDRVTGFHALETIDYVARIKRWFKRFTNDSFQDTATTNP